ncbi:MAG: sulfate ABC transporter permease CysU [Candidatus Aramenus sulfurataquae]|uniref:ABC transporter permease n=3 Tax=Candidatus Aramenus sulfurataquae TaxID=1326980 RepID=A0ACC6TNG0_9CREN|nr:MAG: sulfate ABC transporter permease CysU [Candidatus Aramenus sulfurataquae]
MRILKAIGIFLALLLSLPVLVLVYMGFFVFNSPQAYSSTFLEGVLLTVTSSATAVAVDFALFTPLSYYLSRNRDLIADSLADVPASIPHPIVGVALVFLDSPYTPIGDFLRSLGINFFDTYLGLTSALVVVSAPIYIKSLKSFFDSLPRSYENYARSLGAGELRTFLAVVLPMSYKGIVTSLLVAMSRAMSEFGSIAIIAYYVLGGPFNGVTPAPIQIYEYFGYYGPGVAVTASAIMIVIGLAVLATVRVVQYKLGGAAGI